MNKFLIFLITLILVSNDGANSVEVKPTNTSRLFKLSDYEDSLYVQDILRAARAAEIQSYLNENISPCNNFYQFACANFPKYHPAHGGISNTILQIMADAMKAKLEALLSARNKATDSAIDIKVKKFFKSCMNIKHVARNYKFKLSSIIAEFGKMPVLSANVNWDEEHFDWIAMIAKMRRRYGKTALLQLDITQDFRDNRINCLYIGQPKLILPTRSLYLDNVTAIYRAAAENVIAEKLERFLDVPRQLALRTAAEIMAFEALLAKGMWEGRDETDKMNTPTSTAYLSKKYSPIIDVERFLNLTIGITQSNCMYESVESFQANLKSFLTQVPKYVVANYLYFMLLNDEFFLRWENTEKEQKKLCLSKVSSYFSKAVDNMIYRHSNTRKLEDDLHLIFNHLKETLLQKFLSDELDWMKPKARYNAAEKLEQIRLEINTYEAENLTSEYEEIDFKEDDYIENIRNLLLLKGRQFNALLRQTPKPIDSGALLSFTPVFMIQQNLIKVPVATLQPNYIWASGYPNAVKFGNIGAILGHELIHGFDDEGRKFDKRGNQNNWWDLDSMQAFNERKKCLVEQYSKFQFGSNYLRGNVILSENIADNGGIKLAYDAYMRWYNNVSRTPQDLKRESFSSLKYTSAQLFFISFAQFWCADVSEGLKDLNVAIDSHAPNMYRVIGSLSNLPEFSAAFKCANGTRMNPELKCRVY